MTAAERRALADAQRYAAADRIRFTRHARERMFQRNALKRDVVAAIRTATRCKAQESSWRLSGGTDTDGDELTLIVVFEDGILVVTVF